VGAREVAQRGVELATQELERRGATVRSATNARSRNMLRARLPRGDSVDVYVKTRSAGTWQTDMGKGTPSPEVPSDDRFWMFVDLMSEPATFYIAPAWWIENDIYETDQAFLASHGGSRPRTPSSTHHGIPERRIRRWRERWDLLGFEQ
jgi:hypothetical protein